MSRSRIQKSEAVAIAKKLGATIRRDGAHQLATFEVDGAIILSFGIRHGRKSGHGHLVGQHRELRLNEISVLALARCTMSKEEYIQHLREIGAIVDQNENNA